MAFIKKPDSGARAERITTYGKVVKGLWIALGAGLLFVLTLFIILAFDDLPTFKELENPQAELATDIYTIDGDLLGRFYTENRINVRYQDLSPHLINALVATEDERYHQHAGIDSEALARVFVKTVLLGQQSAGGGSTITQQLAKLLFDRPDLTGNKLKKAWILGSTKLKEWLVAVKLERSYTKEEIMTMYLNQFNFINGAYGIQSASEIYFKNTPDSLKIEEAAMLVGMLKNPGLYNPVRFPERAQKRREVVFFQMKKNGLISQTEYDSLRALPVDMTNFKKVDHNEGLAPHFREVLREEMKSVLAELKKSDGSSYNLYRDGLKIYTTIDAKMQAHAEAAALEHLEVVQEKLFKHWKEKDPWTYKARGVSDRDIEKRLASLERLIRETDRYQRLRAESLPKIKELKLRDADVERMLRIEEDRTLINAWLESGFINQKLADLYRSTMGGENWNIVKKEWLDFQTMIKKHFDTPVDMTVFAYNEQFETDTTMSPLDSLRYTRMFLQTGMLAVDPHSGHIKAWVGGVNHKYFKYDHANKKVARQIGSTFKPFLYALSIDQRGYSPCFKVMDSPVTLEKGTFNLLKDWTPKNVGYYTNQELTLFEGLKQSKNTVSAYLMKDLGSVAPLRNLVHQMGLDTTRVPPQPSIALGTPDISVFEMAGAYTAFANQGVVNTPQFILRIEDKNGNTIYEPVPNPRMVMSEETTYIMLQMLKKVVGGTVGIKTEVGGKTGTTNYHADAWFMGVTPDLVVGTWVGCDDRFIRFRTITYGQGSYMARPIFSKLMKRIEADSTIDFEVGARFKKPKRDLETELDCEEYNDIPGVNPEQINPLDLDPEGEEGDDFDFGR